MDKRSNTSCEDIELSPEDIEYIDKYAWWMEIFSNLCIGVIGVFLNFITTIVLSRSSMRKLFFNRLLICLAVFDNLYLFCEISEVFRAQYYTFTQQHVFARFVYPIRSIFMCASIYMNIALALERYQAITDPVQYRARSTIHMTRRLLTNLIPILVLCVVYYAPKFFDLGVSEVLECKSNRSSTDTSEQSGNINPSSNCTLQYYLTPTAQRTNQHYVLWYFNVSNLLITAFIPVGILIYLITKIYLSLKKFRQRQPSINVDTKLTRSIQRQQCIQRQALMNISLDSTTNYGREKRVDGKKTFILFSIIFVFLFCHSLRFILNMDEFFRLAHFREDPQSHCDGPYFWEQILIPLNQLLLIINPSAHFFIYVFLDQGFQAEISKIFNNFQRVLQTIFIVKQEIEVHTTGAGIVTGTNGTDMNGNAQNIELGVINNNGEHML